MPQRSLHPLVYILLMWLTIISILQVVFIAAFFALGPNGQSSSQKAGKPEGTSGPLNITSPNTTANSEQGTVLNYQVKDVNETIIVWAALKSIPNLISEGGQLHIKRDGYYFLNLRVTLDPCENILAPDCSDHTVFLNYGTKCLLKGWIDKKTHSSGQLSKVKGLSVGEKLKVIIDPPTTRLNYNSTVTHLDIVFMKTRLSS